MRRAVLFDLFGTLLSLEPVQKKLRGAAFDAWFERLLHSATSLTLAEFASQPQHWRVMADLALLSLFAGLYSVPMYALIQMRSEPSHRARIIAANNIQVQ